MKFDQKYNYSGWNFYLSKELLKTKLEELEILWTRGYDDRVRSLDFEIKRKTKELENLKDERNRYENGIEEFRKKIHQKLWKSF
jgi:predicted RNase H-like nuclease (RuvC/YqgF family)